MESTEHTEWHRKVRAEVRSRSWQWLSLMSGPLLLFLMLVLSASLVSEHEKEVRFQTEPLPELPPKKPDTWLAEG